MNSILALALVASTQSIGDGWWRTDGNRIKDGAGNVVRFSGVNWHGMDSENRVMHGLWGQANPANVRTIEDHLDQMKAAGFNLIRLPFSAEIFNGAKPAATALDPAKNGHLLPLTCLEVLDRLIAAAGVRGIRIILDYHRLRGGGAPEGGFWYDSTHSEAQWIANWKLLVDRYKSNPTVVGVDLFNEVHSGVTWEADGVNPTKNWRWAAKRCGNEILSVNPNLLICIQGLDAYHGEGGWWGAVHLGLRDHPLTLSVPNRIVYEVHDYGPLVHDQPFHQISAGFPNNLPGFWDRQWGFIHSEGIAPVWVGEWGALLDDSIQHHNPSKAPWTQDQRDRERLWLPKLRDYIVSRELSWTWWCWTPESDDTHGILKDDYSALNTSKLALISSAMFPGFGPSTTPAPLPVPPPSGQTPYGGTARAVPGTVQAEDFDLGGEGVASHEIDAHDVPVAYRATSGVDLESTSDAGGGWNVSWLSPGEWLEYSVAVGAAGTFTLETRVASATAGGTFHLEGNGMNLTGTLAAPGTGGWQTWQTVTSGTFALPAGTQIVRLVFDSGSYNVNWIRFAQVPSTPPPAGGGPTPAPAPSPGDGKDADNGCGLTGFEVSLLLGLLALRRRSRIES